MTYTIITDSACDISAETLRQWQVKTAAMTFRFDGSEEEYRVGDIPETEFFRRMREGEGVKTAAVNYADFMQLFAAELEQGNDILYLSFSSGMSSTWHTSTMAAGELMEKYPDRRIICLDTLGASTGMGLMVYYAVQLRDQGVGLDELAAKMEDICRHTCHWFTVDDLEYLKRGGRISAAAAFAAGMLNIKPVLHIDKEGHLVPLSKVRGRRQSIRGLADRYEQLAQDKDGVYFIGHGDCIEDAHTLEEMIGHPAARIDYIGAIVGAHSGPGTLALFFLGSER